MATHSTLSHTRASLLHSGYSPTIRFFLEKENTCAVMEDLIIEGTNISPKVSFEPNRNLLEIGGYSRPENVRDFYYPIISWLENYRKATVEQVNLKQHLEPVTFKFKFIYFNSSSAKFIYDIVIELSEFQRAGVPLKIYWYFDEDDEELREAGEELSDMARVPFTYVEIKQQ